MNNNAKPKTLVIIFASLVVLALLSLVSLFTSAPFLMMGRPGQMNTARGNNGRPGALPPANGSSQQGNGQGFQRGNGNDGNFQGRNGFSGFNLFRLTRSFGLDPRVMMYVGPGMSVLGIILLVLSIFGIWKLKKWGLNLGMFMGLFFLIGALPGLFSFGARNINWLRSGINLLGFAASLPVLFLGFLPSVRDHFPRK